MPLACATLFRLEALSLPSSGRLRAMHGGSGGGGGGGGDVSGVVDEVLLVGTPGDAISGDGVDATCFVADCRL